MSKRETSSEIDETAAVWAMRIDDAALDREGQAEFDRWVSGDPRRAGAFARAQAVLVHLKRAKALGSEFEPEHFNREAKAGESGNVAPLAVADAPGAVAPASVLTRRRMLIGASAVAACGAVAVFVPARPASARIFETGKGETRLIPLEDGSTVTLNTASRIALTIDDRRRTAQLLQGEALFKVADGKVPFTVEADDTSVRTVKATFAVCRLEKSPIRVEVCEGNVEIERAGLLAGEKRVLRANTQAFMAADGGVIERSVAPEALERELAWQEGMLSFEDTPLSEAAEEFARYSDRKILIADGGVGAETVTGLFAANNPEGFARAVALGLNLKVRPASGGIALAR